MGTRRQQTTLTFSVTVPLVTGRTAEEVKKLIPYAISGYTSGNSGIPLEEIVVKLIKRATTYV